MTSQLKFGLYGLHRGSSADPDTLTRRAYTAEQAGFESLWVGDHLALPQSVPGVVGDAPDQPRLEAVATLTYLAAVTTTVRLATGVIVLPQRQPVLLAKQLTTVDTLSGGRLIVGLGIGHLEPELAALGVRLKERAARTDEYLAAMRGLWHGTPTSSYDGEYVSFSDVVQSPLPVQRPNPPIVVGGMSAAALRRAVGSANGWYGWELDPGEAADAVRKLAETATRVDRPADLGDLEITVTPPDVPDLATAQRYAEAGVHRLAIQPSTMDGDVIDDLIAKVADDLIGRV